MSKITVESGQAVEISAGEKLHNGDLEIGVLVGLEEGAPVVVFPGNLSRIGVVAKATVVLEDADIGCEVALLFEGGDASKPLVIGRIQTRRERNVDSVNPLSVELDGESLKLTAEKDIVLKCGKASLTLTRAGKIILRGSYVLSRSSGVNSIKGGSIQLN